MVAGTSSLDFKQVVIVEGDVLQLRLGQVIQMVIGHSTGNRRAALTALPASQGKCTTARTTDLVGLIERQHRDLTALEQRITRIKDDITQLSTGFLTRHVDAGRTCQSQRLFGLAGTGIWFVIEQTLDLVENVANLGRHTDNGVLDAAGTVFGTSDTVLQACRGVTKDSLKNALANIFDRAHQSFVGTVGIGLILRRLLLCGACHSRGDAESTDLAGAFSIDQQFVDRPVGITVTGHTNAQRAAAQAAVVTHQCQYIGVQYVDRNACAHASLVRYRQRTGSAPQTQLMIGADAHLPRVNASTVMNGSVNVGINHTNHHSTGAGDTHTLACCRSNTNDQLVLLGAHIDAFAFDAAVGTHTGTGLVVADLDVNPATNGFAVRGITEQGQPDVASDRQLLNFVARADIHSCIAIPDTLTQSLARLIFFAVFIQKHW